MRIAAYPSALATVVPAAVAALKTSHPDVDVKLVDAEPSEAVALVESGEVDVAVAFTYHDDYEVGAGLTWRPTGTERVRLVLPPRYAGSRRPVALGDLGREPWIVGCSRCRAHLADVCRQAGFDPIEHHATDDYVVGQSLVAAGLGVMLREPGGDRGYDGHAPT
ncbi:MAG TPA: LysR substrate-binding domain-containing protein [Kribbella sp.]